MATDNILAVAIAAVSADVSSLGYQYKVPQTSYGIPSYQASSSNIYNTGYATSGSSGSGLNYPGHAGGQQGSVGIGYQSASLGSGGSGSVGVVGLTSGSVGSGYQSGGSGYQSGGSGYQTSGSGFQSGGSGYQSGGSGFQSGGSGFQSGGSGYQSGGSGSVGVVGLASGSAGSGSYQGGAGSLGLGNYVGGGSSQGFQYQQQQVQFSQGPAQVFKHFYVHTAPEEPQVVKTRNPVVLPGPQKHYKIIFIKTPSTAGGASQVVPVQPQQEEKTIVYVLVKKPEDIQDIAVPKFEQKPPSKPEVYFIKYKNKADSQAVINNIVSDYNKGQQTVSVSGLGGDAGGASSGFSGASVLSGSSGSSGGSGLSGLSVLSGSSGSSGSSGLSGISVLSGSSGSSGNSGYSGDSSSYSGQYEVSSGGGSIGSGLSFGQESQGQVASSFGSSGFSSGGSVTPVTISRSEPAVTAVTVGYDSSEHSSGSIGIIGASSTTNYDVNTISASQGVPHETYGIPSFKN